jgi:hypothetical protein
MKGRLDLGIQGKPFEGDHTDCPEFTLDQVNKTA